MRDDISKEDILALFAEIVGGGREFMQSKRTVTLTIEDFCGILAASDTYADLMVSRHEGTPADEVSLRGMNERLRNAVKDAG